MKRSQWVGQDHPRERWLAKLGEEFGEVCNEVVEEIRDIAKITERREARRRLADELGHVILIASCWRDQLQREGT